METTLSIEKQQAIMELRQAQAVRQVNLSDARYIGNYNVRISRLLVQQYLSSACSFFEMWRAAQQAIKDAYVNSDAGYTRVWAYNNMLRFELHPAMNYVMFEQGFKPVNWQQLLLEWPHVSEDDPTQLAYTRDERKGAEGVHTRTSLGKYLARHWPHVRDDARRDWAAKFAPVHVEIWDTKEGIISGIELGPQSCMKSSYGGVPFNDNDNQLLLMYHAGDKRTHEVPWHKHPYSVYCPTLGWRMAVMLDKGRPDVVLSRALVNEENPERKIFVRSYAHGGNCDKLEAALKNMGYLHAGSWKGKKLLRLPHPDDDSSPFMAPYIDGDVQHVGAHRDGRLRIAEDGEFECTNTDGTVDEKDTYGTCADCDATVYANDDDKLWAGMDGDRLVCSCCADDYTYVHGRSGRGRPRTYWVLDTEVVRVNDAAYDGENLPDDIVFCETTGEHALRENCVAVDGEWYDHDDDVIVRLADGDYAMKTDAVECHDSEWRLKADCWESAMGNWFPDDEEAPIDIEAGKYHPNELQEMIDNA